MQLTEQQVDHYRTFGFLVFRQLFTPDEFARYAAEFDIGLDRWLNGQPHDGRSRHAAMLTHETTPFAAGLHDDPRFADAAEQLTGRPMIGTAIDGRYMVGDTPWHSDDAQRAFMATKFAIYLDPLDASTGALRLIPGSHHGPVHDRMSRDPLRDFGVHPEDVPAYSFESKPGDVLVFDEGIWHASFGGSDHRRMGVVVLLEDPQTPEAVVAVQEQIRGAAQRTRERYGQPRYFTDYWRAIPNDRHQRWVRRLDQLGVLD